MTYRQEDMPFTGHGMVPDIIVNPHAFPSRMTIGHLIECIQSKNAAARGHIATSVSFCQRDDVDGHGRQSVVQELMSELRRIGMNEHSMEEMYNPFTGERFWAKICIGPTFYQRLKHMSGEKCHSRARGRNDILTRQPVEGRSRDGGLRNGEMERDAILAHGATLFLKDRLLDNSDTFDVPVCSVCRFMAAKNARTGMMFCIFCNAQQSERLGYKINEQFSSDRVRMVTMPFAFKLLLSEMLAMGVRLAITV